VKFASPDTAFIVDTPFSNPLAAVTVRLTIMLDEVVVLP